MKILIEELQKEIIETYKKTKLVDGLKNDLILKATNKVMIKYGEIKIKRNNLEYELFRVKGRMNLYEYTIDIPKITIVLFFTCISKTLSSKQKRKLKELKVQIDDINRWYCDREDEYKYGKLHIRDSYTIDCDKFINDSFNLQIDNQIT